MSNKKAQGIGVNVVIVAAIALVVLIIIIVMVAGGGRKLADGTNSCVAKAGKCGSSFPGTVDQGWIPSGSTCPDGTICYVYDYGGT